MAATSTSASSLRAYFEQQRGSLIGEIAMSFEHVLASINRLNRNLEAVIAVGNEFSSVEALWSTFEGVMANKEEEEEAAGAAAGEEGRGSDKDAEARGHGEEGQQRQQQQQQQQHGGGVGNNGEEDLEMTG